MDAQASLEAWRAAGAYFNYRGYEIFYRTGGDWDDADKLRIVEESFLGHRQVSATARRHGVSRSLLTTWRRQYRDGELGDETPPSFIPLAVSPMAPAAMPDAARRAGNFAAPLPVITPPPE